MSRANTLAGASAASVALLAASSAGASLIAYEPFDYQTTGLFLRNGGSGFSGPWNTASSGLIVPGLTAPGAISPTGNAATADTPFGFTRPQRPLSPLTPAGGDLWVSYLLDCTSPGGGFGTWLSLGNHIHFGTELAGYPAVAIAPDPDLALASFASTSIAGRGATLLVAHVRWGVGSSTTVDLYVNPLGGPGVPDATATLAGAADPIDRIVLRCTQNATPNPPGPPVFDEIRIGTTFGDVAVPAPATPALLGAASLIVLRRRR